MLAPHGQIVIRTVDLLRSFGDLHAVEVIVDIPVVIIERNLVIRVYILDRHADAQQYEKTCDKKSNDQEPEQHAVFQDLCADTLVGVMPGINLRPF